MRSTITMRALASMPLLGACGGDEPAPPTEPGPTTAWLMVEAGQSATCGLDQDGEAHCVVDGPFALPAPPSGPFADLAVAVGTACALDAAGAISCWGCDFVGSICIPPSDTGYVQIEGAELLPVRTKGRRHGVLLGLRPGSTTPGRVRRLRPGGDRLLRPA